MSAKHHGLVTCPYNKCHQIPFERMNTHLVKCRKDHPNARMKTCPYNSMHIIVETEYNYHLSHCPDSGSLDDFIYSDSASENKYPIQPCIIESSENWDDVNCPTYNPEEHCQRNPILRQLRGGKPAERKAFRMKERIRHGDFICGKKQPELPTPIASPIPTPVRRPETRPLASILGSKPPPDQSSELRKADLESKLAALRIAEEEDVGNKNAKKKQPSPANLPFASAKTEKKVASRALDPVAHEKQSGIEREMAALSIDSSKRALSTSSSSSGPETRLLENRMSRLAINLKKPKQQVDPGQNWSGELAQPSSLPAQNNFGRGRARVRHQ